MALKRGLSYTKGKIYIGAVRCRMMILFEPNREDGEKYAMRSFIVCILHQVLLV
jgi:hypothetical protein